MKRNDEIKAIEESWRSTNIKDGVVRWNYNGAVPAERTLIDFIEIGKKLDLKACARARDR